MDVSTMRSMARQPRAMRRAVITLSGKHRKADDRVRGMELPFPRPPKLPPPCLDGEHDATAGKAWMQGAHPPACHAAGLVLVRCQVVGVAVCGVRPHLPPKGTYAPVLGVIITGRAR
jgi:hypothetical protein